MKSFSIQKRIISYFLVFTIVFSFTSASFIKTKYINTYGADFVVIGGTTIAVKTLIEWTLGMMAACGVIAYCENNPEDVKESAVNVAKAYTEYVETQKDAQIIQSQELQNYYDYLGSMASSGINKGIRVTSNVYNSFKSFVNDYFDTASSSTGSTNIIDPAISDSVSYSPTNNYTKIGAYNNIDDWLISYDFYGEHKTFVGYHGLYNLGDSSKYVYYTYFAYLGKLYKSDYPNTYTFDLYCMTFDADIAGSIIFVLPVELDAVSK